ncbi:MAG: cation:proton antiporter [Opitutales bacterium]|nr:cation:proton antiporter [Opitutales bacterium]
MIGLALILFAAAMAVTVSKALRFPLIPLYLLAGMLLQPVVGGVVEWLETIVVLAGGSYTAPGEEMAGFDYQTAILELGLAFVVFAVGLELSPRRAGNRKKAVLWVGLVQFAVLAAAGFAVGIYWRETVPVAIFLGLAVAASSTLVVIRHLKMNQKMFTSGGRLVTGVLVLQDLLVIIGLVVLMRVESGVAEVLAGLVGVFAVGLLSWFLARYVMPIVVLRGKLGEELLLLTVLTVLSVFMAAAFWLGLPLVVGAFMAGLSLSSFPVNGVVRGLINSMNDFFVALFFLVLGSLIVVPPVEMWGGGVVLLVLLLVVTPPLVKVVAELKGLSSRASLESGLLLAQTSEFSLIVALYAMLHGKIEAELFSLIALVTIISMSWTPFLAREGVVRTLIHLSPLSRWWARRAGEGRLHEEADGVVLFAGMGEAGDRLARTLMKKGREVLVIEEDGVLLHQLKSQGIPFLRGDPNNSNTLCRGGLTKAVAVVSTSVREEENRALLLAMGKERKPLLVPVFDREAGQRFEVYRHIHPVVITDRTTELFLQWFDDVASESLVEGK